MGIAAGSGATRNEDLVRSIVTEGLQGHSVRVFLFGSRARGDARPGSDFDVALLAKEPLPRDKLSRIREALEESHVPVTVDLVDLGEAPAALRAHVLKEGLEWTVSARG